MFERTIRLQKYSEELISEEVKEITSHRPHWMVRSGNVVFLGILLLLLLPTLFVQYPDVVKGSARLVALNAPKTLTSHKEGKLVAINISNGQQVTKGQYLAYMESTASYKEVLQMYEWTGKALAQTTSTNTENYTVSSLPIRYNLGEIQPAYQNLEREWNEYRQFLSGGYYQKKRQALQRELAFNTKLKTNISRQITLTKQDQQLQQIEYAAYDSLAKDKIVAPVELNAYKSKLIGKEQVLAQTDARLIDNDIIAHNKQKELLELQKQLLDQQQKLRSALLLLKSETEKWIQQYVIIAPEEGSVFFVTPLQPNEQVSGGQELFYVQPVAANYYAKLMAGQNGLGKIKEGQVVKLNVESYPSQEYGYIKGVVSSISGFPNRQDSFLVRVDLPNGLKTIYGKKLFFRNNLLARAEIATDGRTLFDHFFEQLKKIWHQ